MIAGRARIDRPTRTSRGVTRYIPNKQTHTARLMPPISVASSASVLITSDLDTIH